MRWRLRESTSGHGSTRIGDCSPTSISTGRLSLTPVFTDQYAPHATTLDYVVAAAGG
jgi:hypothetical protein